MPKNTGRGFAATIRSFHVRKLVGGLFGKRPNRRQMRAALRAVGDVR